MQNHCEKKELLVGFYKVSSNKPSIAWSESVDQAICFGWIDGVRKSIDDETFYAKKVLLAPGSFVNFLNLLKK